MFNLDGARFPAYAQFPHDGASVLACDYQLKVRLKTNEFWILVLLAIISSNSQFLLNRSA